MIQFTEKGRETVIRYIEELAAKRKEILDAGIDTADETELPTIEAIESEIEDCEEEGEYVSSLGVTDHYDSDGPLCLTKGLDYIC